jgi:hypothetical protein
MAGIRYLKKTIHPTYANFEILSVSDTAAVISVSAKLGQRPISNSDTFND